MPAPKIPAAGVILYLQFIAAALATAVYADITTGLLFLVIIFAEPICLAFLTHTLPENGSRRLPMNIKHAISYFCVVAAALLFTLYLDGLGGAFFVVSLLAAPLISLLLAAGVRNGLSCAISSDRCSLDRGDTVHITVTVMKRGFLPSPFVTVRLYLSPSFVSNEPTEYRFVFGFGHHSRTLELDCDAVLWGRGKISVSDILVEDFMELFSFSVAENQSPPCEIRVSPRLADCNLRSELIRQLTDSAAFDDSEEVTSETTVFSGTPGYEHTKYVPGDSLKAVNWKLSAKRGELLVRKPEGSGGSPQTLVLDCFHSADKYGEQLILEAILSVAGHFSEAALPCRLYIRLGGVWEISELRGIGDVEALRFRLTDYVFGAEITSRLPELPPERISRMVIFSANPDASLSAAAGRLIGGGATVRIVAAEYTTELPAEQWRAVSENNRFDFTR